jgi:hypothetical protein
MAEIAYQRLEAETSDPHTIQLKRKLKAATTELLQNHRHYLNLKKQIAESSQNTTDKTISHQALLKEQILLEKNTELHSLLTYIETLEKDIKKQLEIQQQEGEPIPDNAPGAGNWIKRNYRLVKSKFLPTVVTTADLTGTTGFVTDIFIKLTHAISKISHAAKIFFMVIASPLALTAIGAHTLLDTYNVWKNEHIQQRKTRYSANLVTLGLLAVAIPIVLGILAAPVVAVPLVFLGITVVGYAKEEYILKQTRASLIDENIKLQTQKFELQHVIESRIESNSEIQSLSAEINNYKAQFSLYLPPYPLKRYLNDETFKAEANVHATKLAELEKKVSEKLVQDPKIQRLSMQINDHHDQIKTLSRSIKHMEEDQKIRKVFLFSIGCLILGGLLSLVPPLAPIAALFTLIGAVAILGAVLTSTYNRYKHQHENLERKNECLNRNHADEECKTIQHGYHKELIHQDFLTEKRSLDERTKTNSSSKTYTGLASRQKITPMSLLSSNITHLQLREDDSKSAAPINRYRSTAQANTEPALDTNRSNLAI